MFPIEHWIAGLIIGLIIVSTLTAAAAVVVVLIRRWRWSSSSGGEKTAVDPEKVPSTPPTTVLTAKVDSSDEVEKGEVVNDDGVRRYSWKEIEALTGRFDPSKVIGEGGFSTVYLGRFAGNVDRRRCAAVKVLRLRREFRQELDVLRGVRHVGLVRLLGYCDEREEGALVLEYIPDGTLHDCLHGIGPCLPWPHRMSIAYQVASALQYLHESCDPHVIHADVKPPNILLDSSSSSSSSFRSVLCDLGSARTGFSSSVADRSSGGLNSRRRGEHMVASPGYIDPHLVRTGVASRKSDVYSFGMVVMELITGREAVEVDRREVGRAVEAGRVGEVVDGRLVEGVGGYDELEAASVAALAVRCVGEQPSLRPSMGEVVKQLEEHVGKSIEQARGAGGKTGGGGGT